MQAVWNLEGLQPMARVIRVAGAQMGPIQRADPRALTLRRLIALLEEAAARRAELIVFPELAFTTFFPRWLISKAMLDSFFERAMPNANVEALFNRATRWNADRKIPQGPSAGKRGAARGRALPAAREAVFRVWQFGFPGISGGLLARRHCRHDDLQRPPMA